MIEYFLQHRREIVLHTWEHLWLVMNSMLLATAIGIPLGVFLTRRPGWKRVILGGSNIIQVIPSLALFGLLLPTWLGARVDRLAIFALMLYALLPIIRNTYTGIIEVDTGVRNAALGMGLSNWQMLWHVEMPLATRSIIGGLRVATVITVGVATIAAAIGAGGLGEFIFRGLDMVDNRVILAGALPAALLALVADGLFELMERMLQRRRRSRS